MKQTKISKRKTVGRIKQVKRKQRLGNNIAEMIWISGGRVCVSLLRR